MQKKDNTINFMIIGFIFLILLILVAKILKASPYAGDNPRRELYLRVIHIESPTSMNASKAYSIYQETAKYYTKNTNIELHPSGFLSLEEPRLKAIKMDSEIAIRARAAKLWFYITQHKLHHKAKEREIILIIDRALEVNGNYNYSGGHSDNCSLYCHACYSYMHGNSNSSFKIAIHEVGHALGVKGHEANTIMDINIPNFILGTYAKKRIAGCIRKTTKRKRFFCRRKKHKRRCLRRWRLS